MVARSDDAGETAVPQVAGGGISNAAAPVPFVSVVLPIRNEAAHIEACLERLLDQDYPRDRMEILVVDGRSEDGTREIVREVQARHPSADVRLVDNPERIVPPAMNLGIQSARFDIIVRMDGHSVPAGDYVSACVRALQRSGAANVGGVIEPVGATRFGRAVATATGHRLGAGDARYRIGGEPGDVDHVAFGSFRREAFAVVGLFDESLVRNQDDEMNMRLRAAGLRVYLDPAIRVQYTPRGTVRGLWSQYFQYGWWRIETMKRHPQSVRWRQLLPPAVTAAFLGAALLAPFWSLAAFGLALAALTYGVLVSTVALRVARPQRDAGLVALAFVVMHFGYGFGFLCHALTWGRYPYRARPPRVPRLRDAPTQGSRVASGRS